MSRTGYRVGVNSAVVTPNTISSTAVLAVTTRKPKLPLPKHNAGWLSLTVTCLQLTADVFTSLLVCLLSYGSLAA